MITVCAERGVVALEGDRLTAPQFNKWLTCHSW